MKEQKQKEVKTNNIMFGPHDSSWGFNPLNSIIKVQENWMNKTSFLTCSFRRIKDSRGQKLWCMKRNDEPSLVMLRIILWFWFSNNFCSQLFVEKNNNIICKKKLFSSRIELNRTEWNEPEFNDGHQGI